MFSAAFGENVAPIKISMGLLGIPLRRMGSQSPSKEHTVRCILLGHLVYSRCPLIPNSETGLHMLQSHCDDSGLPSTTTMHDIMMRPTRHDHHQHMMVLVLADVRFFGLRQSQA